MQSTCAFSFRLPTPSQTKKLSCFSRITSFFFFNNGAPVPIQRFIRLGCTNRKFDLRHLAGFLPPAFHPFGPGFSIISWVSHSFYLFFSTSPLLLRTLDGEDQDHLFTCVWLKRGPSRLHSRVVIVCCALPLSRSVFVWVAPPHLPHGT